MNRCKKGLFSNLLLVRRVGDQGEQTAAALAGNFHHGTKND